MSRLQLVARGMLVASILTIVACSSGGGGDFVGPKRVDRADSQTRFDVTVDDSGETTAQLDQTSNGVFAQLKSWIIPQAWAAPVSGAEILIAYVNENGLVIDILSAEDGLVVNDNGDGTYTVVMPDDPRVDGMIVTSASAGIDFKVGQQLPDGSFYAPAVGEDVTLSPGATAATRVALNYINDFDAVTDEMMENLVANLTAAAAKLIEQGQADSLLTSLDASYGNYVLNTLLQAQQEIIADVSGYNGEYFQFAQHDVLLANTSAYTQQQLWDLGLASLSVSPALEDAQGDLLPVNAGALSFQDRQAETTQAASQVDYTSASRTRSEPAASWTGISSDHNSIRDSGQLRIKLPAQNLTLASNALAYPESELLAYGTKATTGAVIGSVQLTAGYASTSSTGYSHINPWILIPRASAFDIATLSGSYGAVFSYNNPQAGEVHRYTSGVQRYNATSGSFTSVETYNASTNSLSNDGSVSSSVQAMDLGSFNFSAQANGVLGGGYGNAPVSVSSPDGRFIHSAFGINAPASEQGRLSLVKLAQGSNSEPLTFGAVANKIYAIVGNQHVLQQDQFEEGAFTGTINFTDAENTSYISGQSQSNGLSLTPVLASQPAQAVANNLFVNNHFITGTTITNSGEISFNAGPRVFRGFIQTGSNLLVLHSFLNTNEDGERLDAVSLYAVCVKGCTTTMAGQSFGFSASISGANTDLQVQLDQNSVETIAQASNAFTSANTIPYGAAYALVVTQAPTGQACRVSNGTGVAIADVDNVSIDCVNTYSVSGNVTGLTAPLTLALNEASFESITVAADGGFSFSKTIDQDQNYDVIIATQPVGQLCALTNASGSATANVSDVAVNCSAAFTLGGTVSGLNSDIGLSINGGATQTLSANGAYTFGDSLTENSAYTVTIATQPIGQECQVVNASGTLTAAISNIDINCGNVSTIGGTVSGLSASLDLSLNGGASQTITADGAYTFSNNVAQDAAYTVTIASQPVGQVCTLTNASGNANSNVNNVDVSCVTAHTISGTAAGIGAAVELSLGSQSISVSADGSFNFSPVATGTAYTIAISQAPVAYSCSLTNATGTATADVSNVTLNCAIKTYTLSGTATGVSAAVVLSNNGGDDLNIAADGSFNFVSSVNHGDAYAVTVKTQVVGQTCTLNNASGTATADVSNIALNCGVSQYQVGGNVTGLNGSLVLSNNGGDDLSLSADGNFNFASTVAHDASYTVSIKTQPLGQVCSLTNETAVATANVSDIAVTCVTNTYVIGGTVANLSGTLVLTNNGGDDLSLSTDGNLSFASEVAHGGAYSVAIKTQPSDQVCTLSNAAGTATSNVNNIAVSCQDKFVVIRSGGDCLTRATGDLRAASCNSSDVNQHWKLVNQGGNNISIQSLDGTQCATRNSSIDFGMNNGCPAAGDTSGDEIFDAQASDSQFRLKSSNSNVCMFNLSGRIGGSLGNCGVALKFDFFFMAGSQKVHPATGANL